MKKSIFSTVLTLCLLLTLLPFGAQADAWEIRWNLSAKGELTVTGSGAVPDNWTQNDASSWARRAGDVKSAEVGSGFTYLGSGMFADCPKLERITIPATVTKLGAGVFRGSEKLLTVVYGGNEAAWSRIGWEQSGLPAAAQITFRGEPAPTPTPAPTPVPTVQPTASPDGDWSYQWRMTPAGDLTVTGHGQIPDHWVDTGSGSWRADRGRIRSVVIGEGITYLGAGTLSDLPRLTSVTIPATVVSIARGNFSGSSAVRDVYFGGTEAAWKAAGGENAGLPQGAVVHFAGQPAPASPFVDVPSGAYYADAVRWAVARSITMGKDSAHFDPDGACTRAQVVTFLWRAFGGPAPTGGANPFSDVSPDRYYYSAVRWAVEQKITTGTDRTHFDPDAPCTRAQVVTFLWRADGARTVQTANPFADVPAGAFYTGAVLWAVSQRITTGTDETHFSPDGVCTRAQVVTFLWRGLA